MQNIAIVCFGFVILVIQTTVSAVIPMHAMGPNLVLPIALYLGVSQGIPIVRGALVSFTLGYLLDAFCGNPMGLQTFVIVSAFIVARGAGLRLFFRGAVFQILMGFVISLIAGITTLTLPAIFEGLSPVGSYRHTFSILVGSALVTAVLTPVVFIAIEKISSWFGERGEESSKAT
jgi:rod shape-determining protein MreD